MCIPYIFLNFIFLLITASIGPKRLYKSLVISCPNTSLITFTAWVLETLLPSATGPKFPVRKAKPDRSMMAAVCGLPRAATAPQLCPAGQSPVAGAVPATRRTFHSQEECKNNTGLLERASSADQAHGAFSSLLFPLGHGVPNEILTLSTIR